MVEHYYSEEQSSKFKIEKIKAFLRGKDFEFYTSSGVFSIKKVDKGTETLINNCILKDGWDVLDLGCGYGVVGIVVKEIFGSCNVVMTDINRRAIKLAIKNLELNNVECEVLQGNLYDPVKGKKFDTILTNPPYAAGRDLCFKIIEESVGFLKKGGLLQLVARHQKGGKMLKSKMLDVFGNVEEVAKKSGYRVYVSSL
ncbi:class I SAM-dependent methyltransferase [Candidatus Woesearchaeota archaeon]|nr:class I SAM-dependent methyltransferase [Candidatus Woesearchaeota archaeon]